MFSWSKKKETKRRGRPDRDSEENEFGVKIDKGQNDKQLEAELRRLAGVDSLPDDDLNLNEGEEDEEAELLRLIGGGKGGRHPKRTPNVVEPIGELADLTADVDVGDEDVEVDENDAELLGELLELTNPEGEGGGEEEAEAEAEAESESEEEEKAAPTGDPDIMTTLKERLKMYKTAEAKAKENNETSRARRFSRGIKTLDDLIKKAKAGKAVSPSDIPPVIAMNLKPGPPPVQCSEIPAAEGADPREETAEAEQPQVSNSEAAQPGSTMTILVERLKLYQTAEAKAKESGESTRARRFNRGIKTLEGLIKSARAGNEISPGDIPPVIALNLKPAPPPPVEPSQEEENEESIENEMSNINLTIGSDDVEPRGSEEPERNILDVLSERLKMYRTAEEKAKETGESSRARRFNRGVKALQDLIRQATAGKPIAPDDIPPVVALNLKAAPPVQAADDDSPREAAMERETPVASSDSRDKPLSFMPADDVDLEAELGLEEDAEGAPTTVLEGLEQRARFYGRLHEEAAKEGNSASADQNERIARVYLNAIKTFKSGGFVDVERLPNPRGCPPIPIPFFAE